MQITIIRKMLKEVKSDWVMVVCDPLKSAALAQKINSQFEDPLDMLFISVPRPHQSQIWSWTLREYVSFGRYLSTLDLPSSYSYLFVSNGESPYLSKIIQQIRPKEYIIYDREDTGDALL